MDRALLRLGLATGIAVAIFATLGTWQLRRLAWKEALIATAETRAHAEAIAAPGFSSPISVDPAAHDFTRVRVEGRYLSGGDLGVQALLGRPHGRFGGPGHWVMRPLERPDGAIVWINRGFVPNPPGRRFDPTRIAPPPAGTVAFAGLLRPGEPRGALTPADDPATGQFFVRDPIALSIAAGLPLARVLPYTIDADAATTPPGGLPQAGETRISFPNDHLGYAITWYGLALSAAGVFGAVVRARRAEGAAAAAIARRAANG